MQDNEGEKKMVCENLKQKPKNKILRNVIGSIDGCKHLKEMKGINFRIDNGDCAIEKLCKYYKEESVTNPSTKENKFNKGN